MTKLALAYSSILISISCVVATITFPSVGQIGSIVAHYIGLPYNQLIPIGIFIVFINIFIHFSKNLKNVKINRLKFILSVSFLLSVMTKVFWGS